MKKVTISLSDEDYEALKYAAKSWSYRSVGAYISASIKRLLEIKEKNTK